MLRDGDCLRRVDLGVELVLSYLECKQFNFFLGGAGYFLLALTVCFPIMGGRSGLQ